MSASVNRMIVSEIIWMACLVMAVEADPCLDNQHCSDCDNRTGHCLTECDTGYFDLKCLSVCDGHCIGNLCNQSAAGSGRCTEGCELGYQGPLCNIPCDSPGDNCTYCPGGCDGGYCQLGSSCVSGCADAHYGRDCESGDAVGLPVGLSIALLSFILIVVLIVYFKYWRRVRQHRVPQTEDPVLPHTGEIDDASVQELEWYTEIQLTDTASEPPGNHNGGGEDAGVDDDVYDVADGGKHQCVAVSDIYSKLSHTQ